MNIKVFDTKQELDAYAADLLCAKVAAKPNAVLGLATGSTPIGIYKELAARHRAGLSFQQVTTYNLDEYVGLDAANDQSYAYYMRDQLFSLLDIPADQTHLPQGMAEDLDLECERYDTMLQAQPVDIQLLGLGHNGHIGFNEPDAKLSGGTHVVKLKEETREANARFFSSMDEVPRYAITMGVGSILKADTIILAACGADKSSIVEQALTGPITTEIPASLLQTHPRVIVLLDREAAQRLTL
ncbi:glucosamine-6-phosphate deaminase [Paenibacillus sp. GCM10023252]|uniref:glucosamine-6-phosphate deaminase n=1 Tax=Paenibacillus sp. GCM10023252 TaxID=3252649 RepID=UPI0036160BD5